MDVTTAYLQGKLNEEISISQPERFEENKHQVYRLKKTMYGQKQSGRAWNRKLNN